MYKKTIYVPRLNELAPHLTRLPVMTLIWLGKQEEEKTGENI